MAIHNLDFWFDGQQRRFLEQIVAAFSGFQYQTGWRNGEEPKLMPVPVRMANTDRMVGHIMRNLSENTLLTCPMITINQTGLTGRRSDVQNPGFVDTLQVIERKIDENGRYTNDPGNRLTVQRIMPRPFEMAITVDIWTSNRMQKDQLLEQILPVIYPTFDVQNSTNGIDWTALTTIEVENITLTSRSIPVGTESEIDIASIELRLPIWLSPPAKVKQQKIINTIITNIFESGPVDAYGEPTRKQFMAQHVVTPGNHRLRVEGNVLRLLNSHGGDFMEDSETGYEWDDLIKEYGLFKPGVSRIALNNDAYEIENENLITGLIMPMEGDPNALQWQIDIDTLPSNTLRPVDALINAGRTGPGAGLPVPAEGIRYLLVEGGLSPSVAWGQFTAEENDIIEFRGGQWVIDFKARDIKVPHYVLNTTRSQQLRWSGTEWSLSIDGDYAPGFWKLMLG